MVPLAGKALFCLAVATLVASVSYGVATDDGSATAILAFVAMGAIALGAAVSLADADRAPYVAPDAPSAQLSPPGGRPALPSPWPLVGAVSLGVLALAAATDAVIVVTGVVLVVIAGLGWLFQTWTEHPSYTARFGARLKERLVVPIGLPLGVITLVAVIAISLSRVFLAVPEQGARAVALAVAVVILVSAFGIAASQRMARTALGVLCTFAFVAVVAAGVAGLNPGERKFEKVGATKTSGDQPGQPTQSPGPTGGQSGGSTGTTPTGAANGVGGNSAESGVPGGAQNLGGAPVGAAGTPQGSTNTTAPGATPAGAAPNGSGSGSGNPTPNGSGNVTGNPSPANPANRPGGASGVSPAPAPGP